MFTFRRVLYPKHGTGKPCTIKTIFTFCLGFFASLRPSVCLSAHWQSWSQWSDFGVTNDDGELAVNRRFEYSSQNGYTTAVLTCFTFCRSRRFDCSIFYTVRPIRRLNEI
jgi:hypothetical protein